jgi:hypothetical protein
MTDARLEALAGAIAEADPELSAAVAACARGADADVGLAPEAWFDHVNRLPDALREQAITTLADQSRPVFGPVTIALAASAPLPYQRVFALKRLPRFASDDVRGVLEGLYRGGQAADYGPYFASVCRQIDPEWAGQLLASAAPERPASRPRPDPDDEDWGPDAAGVGPTLLIAALSVIGLVASVAWALRLLPRWMP